MPSLLCLSPMLLDQSFPKDDIELAKVKIALASLQELMEDSLVHLLLTEYIIAIGDSSNIDFLRFNNSESLREIIQMITIWILQPSECVKRINLPNDLLEQEYTKHVIPKGMENKGLIEIWSDELGKLLYYHDLSISNSHFFIGIACDSAFSGNSLGSYINPNQQRCFPLIGPDNISILMDAYDWKTGNQPQNNQITKEELINNYSFIGIREIQPPKGTSHSKCVFANGNFWILDLNNDIIPHNHMRTLSIAANLPRQVIIYSIKNKEFPTKEFRLKHLQ